MSKKAEIILLWILRIGLVFSLATPLLYADRFLFPFVVPRVLVFQLLISFLLVISATLIAFYPHHRPKFSKIALALLCYFIIVGITTATSIYPEKSFLGTMERSFGFFNIIHLGFYFIALHVAFKNERVWHMFLFLMCVVSLFISQDFLLPTIVANGPAHATSLGNRSFLASYLMLNIFFAVYLFTVSKNRFLRIFFLLAALLELATVFATNVRGALVGCAAGTLFFAVHAAWKNRRLRLSMIVGILLFVSLYAFIFINKNSPFLRDNFVVQRITNISSHDETLRARLAMWKMAFAGFLEHPFLGWGRENYALVFNLHFDPSFDNAHVGEMWEDRAHNIFLDELITGGLLGLAAYILLVGVVFAACRKKPLFLAGLIAYSVQNFFGVENLNSALVLFTFIAFVDFQEAHSFFRAPAKKLSPLFASFVSATAVITLGFFGYFFTIQPAHAVQQLWIAANATLYPNDEKEFEDSLRSAKKLSQNFPSRMLEGIGALSDTVIQSAFLDNNYERYAIYMGRLSNELNENIKSYPAEQRWMVILVKLLIVRSIVEKTPSYLDAAEEKLKNLLVVSPQRKLFKELAAALTNARAEFVRQ